MGGSGSGSDGISEGGDVVCCGRSLELFGVREEGGIWEGSG